ncbi:cytochrome c [Moritella sp. Urea-trap-13]|uniref:c-type cytochrome n=1 Tax=Moritella sp. Urea-trap-13 TaxID=2058327 RepID=UPI000C326BDD|nr:cytochrome c [Moritella sp. Urea-trap-13]PKH04709.1 cytochrome C [Moritella sp. Urea-trap-13]
MFWSKTLKLAGLTSLMMFSTAQAATFDKAETDIKYRQSALTMIAINFSDMADMVKGKKQWDDSQFQLRAMQLSHLVPMAHAGFASADSQEGNTKAKSEIWKDTAGFDKKFAKFTADTKNLAFVSARGERGDIKKAFGQTAKNCKSCHSDYKFK